MIKTLKKKEFIAGIVPPADYNGPALWFVFQGNNLLVSEESSSVTIPCLKDFSELGLASRNQNYLGLLGRSPLLCGGAPGRSRSCLQAWPLKACARSMAAWMRTCSGSQPALSRLSIGTGLIGSADDAGSRWKPRRPKEPRSVPSAASFTSLVLLRPLSSPSSAGTNCSLARSRRFTTGMYSVLAGFVEPGESLEETVSSGSEGRGRHIHQRHSILRKPALALSSLAHDRFYGDVCGRRDYDG